MTAVLIGTTLWFLLLAIPAALMVGGLYLALFVKSKLRRFRRD